MKIAYSYLRWSTAGQGDSGKDSRKRQTESVERWIKDYGKGEYILSTDTFVDAGKSGFKGKHVAKDEYGKAKGDLMRFIQLVEAGKISNHSILCIDSFDRFSRLKPTSSLTLFMQVIDSGIGLVFTGSNEKRIINSDLINKEGYVLQFIIGEMIRSYNESAEKSRKIISAKQNKKERMKSGEIVAHNNMPKYFTFSNGRYHHNEKTKIVREMIDGIIEGKSLYGIADGFNQRQIPTFKPFTPRQGKITQWSGNTIGDILRNRLLIGEYLGCKNFVPAITDETTFNKIQNILAHNGKFNRGKVGTFINIFRGVCFCSDCGKTMSVAAQVKQWSTGKSFSTPYRYLKCSVFGSHVACKNRKSFRLGEMEEEFFLNFIFKHPKQLINGDDNREASSIQKDITKTQTRLNQITKEIQTVVGLLSDVPMDELKTKLAKLNKDREAVKHLLDSFQLKLSKVQDSPETYIDLRKMFDDEGGPPPIKLKRENGKLVTEADFDDYTPRSIAVTEIRETLKDSYVREGVRMMLPNLIGKITVDTVKGQFYVFNHSGKMVYESKKYSSNRNNSEKWREACATWSKKGK